MVLRLKEYQERALQSVAEYLSGCVRMGDPAAAFAETTEMWWGRAIPYRGVAELPGLPYVCVRVPTGGGKTLMACCAAGIALRELLGAQRGVVLWLVPSNAIRDQTLKCLRDRYHPYRCALEQGAGPVEIMDIAEALYLQRATVDGETVVIVSTMQAFRVEDTEGRKVYEESGALMAHFEDIPTGIWGGMDRREDGSVIPSLANVMRVRRPIVIVDEAHNARTELSFATLARFRPSCILEFTATPDTERSPSNVLCSVSAAELKAEAMIKMPIRLETGQDWKELLGRAITMRGELETIALDEERKSGEHIRPVTLIQAQPQREAVPTICVEVVEKCLQEEFKIPPGQIARATGRDRELEGVDLLDPQCQIRFVITIQALREGWDCPFAYVLCSLAETHSSRAVEQILGRVLRLPGARKKTHPELNTAYAFASSASFVEAATALTEALVQNGFERQEAQDLVRPLARDQEQLLIPKDDLFYRIVTVPMPETPSLEVFGDAVREVVSFDLRYGTMTVNGVMSERVREELRGGFSTGAGKAAVEEAFRRSQWHRGFSGAERLKGMRLAVPVLAVRVGDLFEQFEETHLLDHPWNLSECAAVLREDEFSSQPMRAEGGEIDVTESGELHWRFLPELQRQIMFTAGSEGWTEAELVNWLDRSIQHRDITCDEFVLFLVRVVTFLVKDRGLGLHELVLNKFRLRRAVTQKIQEYRLQVRSRAFQAMLFPEEHSPVAVSPELCFSYDLDEYPFTRVYAGSYVWKKHYYDRVGDLDPQGEEFECAVLLDQQVPQVRRWVRNLERRANFSFWLQTPTDKFYPDFVCELNDGRHLVVEYKGEHLWSNEDSREKRLIGEIWEKRSGGRCLFIMPKGKDFGAICAKVL